MKTIIITLTNLPDNSGLKQLERSLNHFDLDYVIIQTEWKGFGTKIIETYNYLKHNKEDYTHFIFVDAHDTFFLSGMDEIENKYKQLGSPNYLFSCEKACWPDSQLSELYPNCESDWKYLNSGAYMANIDKFIELVEKDMPEYHIDDQRYYTKIFLKSKEIALDYNCEIFQSYSFISEDDYTYLPERCFNNKTLEMPVVFHGNGKTDLSKIYKLIK